MEMDKLIRLQIARTGSFGADGRSIVLQDLQDVVDTFDGRAPISLGHFAARRDDWWPSFGNVENLMLQEGPAGEGVLVADITVRDVLWDAIKTGFYPGWSVSIPTKPDGKHYLHHLAFLGAMPPAIRDLQILKTADGEMPEDAVKDEGGESLDPSATALYSYADFPETGYGTEVVQDGQEEDAAANEDDGEGQGTEADAPPAQEENRDFSDPQPEAGQGENPAIAKARRIFSTSVKARLDAAMEGRVPAGLRDKVHEFADEALAEWDFSDDAEEPKMIRLFREILESMQKLPKPGRMDFSDNAGLENGTRTNPAELARKF